MRAPLKIILLLSVLVLQTGYVVHTIIRAEDTLHHGEIYRFATAALDPSDPFRGRYVTLSFAVEEQGYDAQNLSCEAWKNAAAVYAYLQKDADDVAQITQLSRGDQIIAGDRIRVSLRRYPPGCGGYTKDQKLHIRMPFSRFFTNELKAPDIEKEVRKHRDTSYLVVRILGDTAVPERLEIGKSD